MRKALQDAVPEAAQIQIVIGFFENLTKRVFEKKVAKIKLPYYTTNPGCQKVTLPEEAQIQIVLGNFEICLSLFCRQSAGIPINSSVASGPYLPHVKDCAGLE